MCMYAYTVHINARSIIMYVFLLLSQVEKASGGGSVRGRGRWCQWRRGRRGRSRGHRWWRTWARTRSWSWSRAGAWVLLQTEHVRLGLLLPRQLLAPHRDDLRSLWPLQCLCHANRYILTSLLCCSKERRKHTAGHLDAQQDPKWLPSSLLLFFFCSILPVRHEWSRFPESPHLLYQSAPRVNSNFYAMLQYSMTNKVSLTRRCCSWAESSTCMMTSRVIVVHGFRGVGGFGVDASPLSLSVQILMGTTELFSVRRHSVYVIALSSLFPSASFM